MTKTAVLTLHVWYPTLHVWYPRRPRDRCPGVPGRRRAEGCDVVLSIAVVRSDFLPLACNILSEKLAGVGYLGHFVGKVRPSLPDTSTECTECTECSKDSGGQAHGPWPISSSHT